MQNSLKFLDVFIGNRCNLACEQCDTRSDVIRTSKNDPDLENIKESITLAQDNFAIEYYSMLGGEPLLYLSKVKEIVKFIRQRDTTGEILIPTNGTVLHKRFKELADLMLEYRVSLAICNHYAAFEDTALSDSIKNSGREFVKYLGLPQADSHEFFIEMNDWRNRDNDPNLKRFLELKNFDINNRTDPEEFYSNGDIWVWLRDQPTFHSHYRLDEFKKPKPFMSGNPTDSYTYGCCSSSCSFLHDKKLYKCGAIGTLRTFLEHHGSLDDPDWQKYLNYKALDLTNCTPEEIKYFSDTKYREVDTCDMCPSSGNFEFTKTRERVIPIKAL